MTSTPESPESVRKEVGMTEENATETTHVNQWPHDATKVDQGSVTFAPFETTIARVINGPGYVFDGDDTATGRFSEKTHEEYRGAVWWLQGEWNETLNGRTAPIDPGFKRGQRVIAHLSARKGDRKTFYNCLQIKAASGPQSTHSAPIASGGGTDQRDETRASIERQTAFKGQTGVVCALISGSLEKGARLESDELIKWAEMRDALWGNAEPLPGDEEREPGDADWGPKPPATPEEGDDDTD